MSSTVAAKVHSYVVDRFLFGKDGHRLQNDASFLEQSLIDSTGVLELVAFLEEQYGIKVDDDELVPENLDSVNRIAQFVERKQTAAKIA
jgi:acyl carrier protein